MRSPAFKKVVEQVSWHNDEEMAGVICFAWNMAKIHGAAQPGTRKFLQQIQDMILTHCDPPNPRRKPMPAVRHRAHLLDRHVLAGSDGKERRRQRRDKPGEFPSALNLAHMHHLKQVGNVRLCKNWQEKRDELTPLWNLRTPTPTPPWVRFPPNAIEARVPEDQAYATKSWHF
ncbi:hypothetical protein CONLIGDRAFT_697161 [Coniochaeta ligniaria NRRL 30616]|uniref:Uncharacterized protein n=1 Tax=Coniochaeta ligniaria NRRL 30616 TaxID=1408157 RepID=A0A1J7JVZ4_9PEZI|nr:hypothetical protein CONLIGDRAFT_697161 [Coniochaeta ligniaria NRRL 30616]